MSSMADAIIPKSDQLNSDDLIAGPITIKVTEVTIRGGQEQPVSIHYEGDNGKPYKSCKSMNRVLVTAWGPDATQYVGRSMTLYRDPTVKWGGMEVGGIRISHLSHMESPLTMALTATKGSRKPYTVRPLEAVAPAAPKAKPTPAERTAAILARFDALRIGETALKDYLGKEIHTATKADLEGAWLHFSSTAAPDAAQ